LCVVGGNSVNRHSAKFRNYEFLKAQTFPRLRLQFDHKRAETILRA
jgi:hypothetical protein